MEIFPFDTNAAVNVSISIQFKQGREVAVTNGCGGRYCGNCSACVNSGNVTTARVVHPKETFCCHRRCHAEKLGVWSSGPKIYRYIPHTAMYLDGDNIFLVLVL